MSAPHSVFTPSDLKLDAQWMPFTANRAFQQDPRIIVAAEGNYFIDDKGRRIFDSLSGLWTCGAGHNRKEIQEAVSRQLGTLDYAPGFQYGHPLAFRLAEENHARRPGPRAVYRLRLRVRRHRHQMAKAYWRLKGQPSKTRFIGRARGYHGVNIGGTALGGIGGNRKLYGQLMDATTCRTPCNRAWPLPVAWPKPAVWNWPMSC
jgi:beta-alanine--pyruvate transaminase